MSEIQGQILNRRALTSLFMLFSFLLLPLSGVPLHFSRTEAEPGVSEHFLMSVHNSSALIFLIAAVIHLTFNWNAITKYVATKTTEYFRLRKELILALVIITLLVGLFSSHALHVR